MAGTLTSPRPRTRVLPTLAALALPLLGVLLWARGTPRFVGWEVARDHERCLHRPIPRARLFTSEPAEAREWLESRGTPVPPLPRHVRDLTLIGVRYCPLADRIAAHIFYGSERGQISVFVLAGPARIGAGWAGSVGRLHVHLLHSAGRTLAIVGPSSADVDAMARAFRTSLA